MLMSTISPIMINIPSDILLIAIIILYNSPAALLIVGVIWALSKLKVHYLDVYGYILVISYILWRSVLYISGYISCIGEFEKSCNNEFSLFIAEVILINIIVNLYMCIRNKWRPSRMLWSVVIMIVFITFSAMIMNLFGFNH